MPPFPRRATHFLIRTYQVTLSALIGRQCRYLPTCSTYTDEAIQRHGLWAGGWIGAARICRCHPWGASGFDPVPVACADAARWYLPWRYGRWHGISEPEPAVSEPPQSGPPESTPRG